MHFRLMLALSALLAGVSAPSSSRAATAPGSSRVLYQASWSGGLRGWTSAGHPWTVQRGVLGYAGIDASILLSPRRAPRTGYAVEAVIRLMAWKDTGVSENHGFGLLVRASRAVDPTVATAGLMAGVGRGFMGCEGLYSQAVVATADTDLVSLKQRNDSFRPGHVWHTYRVEVRGDTIRVAIDGRVRTTVTTRRYAGATGVGLFSLAAQLQVKSFRILGL